MIEVKITIVGTSRKRPETLASWVVAYGRFECIKKHIHKVPLVVLYMDDISCSYALSWIARTTSENQSFIFQTTICL